MTLVLTNDDGIGAPGIRALWQTVRSLQQSAVIIAPFEQHSGCGHQVTTTTPISIERWAEYEWAVKGTPVDCTRLALSHLCPNAKWVISGINAGGNLGVDAYISGTVAAAREAAFHRIPAIAISHYRHGKRPIDWQLATQLSEKVLHLLFQRPVTPGTYWNVNLPHLEAHTPDPDIVFCKPCTQPLPATYQLDGEFFVYAGEYGKRARDPGGDVDICFSGQISVTQISV